MSVVQILHRERLFHVNFLIYDAFMCNDFNEKLLTNSKLCSIKCLSKIVCNLTLFEIAFT